MADHGIIDVNAQIGPAHGQAAGASHDDLIRERRAHGVRLSLTRHRNATFAESSLGNQQVIEAAERDPGLVPIGALAIDRTDDYLLRPRLFADRVAGFWLEGSFEGRGAPTPRRPPG